MTTVVSEGESYLYLRVTDAEGKTILVKARIIDDETLLFLSVGDTVTVTALPTDKEGVYTLVKHQKQ